MTPPRDRFLALLRTAVQDGHLVKLTLGKYRGADPTLQNLHVRPVTLKAGSQFSFVWRHAKRDVTKNFAPAEALVQLEALIGADFLDAHLFTPTQTAQLETNPAGPGRLHVKAVAAPPADSLPRTAKSGPPSHDRAKAHVIPESAPWLCALGVTNPAGRPREGMSGKFRQIQRFTELLAGLIDESGFAPEEPLCVADMGCGKGYLTFATAALLGPRAHIQGVEARPELVARANETARAQGFAQLEFVSGTIADTSLPRTAKSGPLAGLDIVIALHACDTATDDALAAGIAAGARLLVVSPCCHQELRPQLVAPPVLAPMLRHGIFHERQAELVTDALRALLLEWAGYRTKVFEFISTEHTAKNLMIAAIRAHPQFTPDSKVGAARAETVRDLAAFFQISDQRLARNLGFPWQCPQKAAPTAV